MSSTSALDLAKTMAVSTQEQWDLSVEFINLIAEGTSYQMDSSDSASSLSDGDSLTSWMKTYDGDKDGNADFSSDLINLIESYAESSDGDSLLFDETGVSTAGATLVSTIQQQFSDRMMIYSKLASTAENDHKNQIQSMVRDMGQ